MLHKVLFINISKRYRHLNIPYSGIKFILLLQLYLFFLGYFLCLYTVSIFIYISFNDDPYVFCWINILTFRRWHSINLVTLEHFLYFFYFFPFLGKVRNSQFCNMRRNIVLHEYSLWYKVFWL